MGSSETIGLILACAGIFVFCDIISAMWAKNNNFLLYPLFLLAPIGYIIFGYINKMKNLSISSGLVNAIVIILTIFAGVFIFDNDLTARQIFGLVFAIIAVLLML